MNLRRFNATGLERFGNYVLLLKTDGTLPAPIELLEDDSFTTLVEPLTDTPEKTFENRLSAAKYLDNLLERANLDSTSLSDTSLWAWLTLRFFDQLRPLGAKRKGKMGLHFARFIPAALNNHMLYYRHLLRHPLQVYRQCNRSENAALCFLVQPVDQPGDVVEGLASRLTYVRSTEIMTAISSLFVDKKTMSIKPKASSKANRLHWVLSHFDCTWDLGYIAKDLLVPMLPKDFDQFKD